MSEPPAPVLVLLRLLGARDPAHPLLGSARRRHTLILSMCLVALIGLTTAVWASPGPGPVFAAASEAEAELERERARADDLKAQLDAATARLSRPRPPASGEAAAAVARAEDLKAQLDAANARLEALGTTAPVDGQEAAQQARADDLKAQLERATARLQVTRPGARDTSAQARAEDLAAQVDRLSTQLAAPRPLPPPPAPRVVMAAPPPPPMLSRDQVVRSRDLFGLYTKESPFFMAEFDALEVAVDRDANVSGYFQGWSTPFRPDVVRSSWARGEIPLITWESHPQSGEQQSSLPEFSNAAILSGRHDAYVRQYAADVALNAQTVVIRFDHEMNGDWYPWSEGPRYNPATGVRDIPTNGNAPGSYVAMWRHVHDIFEAEGANQHVVWLWAPNRVNRLGAAQRTPDFLASLYPGDEYVDMVGMSGYFRNGYDPSSRYPEVYGATLAQLAVVAPSKPVVLAEVGAAETAGDKAAFVQAFLESAAADPRVAGFVWFSLTIGPSDFRVDSSPGSTEAFRTGIATSPFGRPRV